MRREATTRGDGSYRFDQLRPGTYTLTEVQPAGYLDARDTAGSLGGAVEDDRIVAIAVAPGDRGAGYDFGEHRAPAFTSTPIADTPPGKPYEYDAHADDPEGDPLHYTLLDGPLGMAVAGTSGRVTWAPTLADRGAHEVRVRVDDGRGGVDEQHYILTVDDTIPNRPPRFTSDPVVDAFVNRPYTYPATAFDPDRDDLTFAKLDGPDDLTIEPTTGAVTWTPGPELFTADQVDAAGIAVSDAVAVAVVLQVVDGRGGVDTQPYTILVRPEPRRVPNRPPIIVSDPVTTLRLPDGNPYPTVTFASEVVGGSLPQGAKKDHSFGNNPLTIGGTTFAKGLGTDPTTSAISIQNPFLYSGYPTERSYRRFQAWIGVDDEVGDAGRVRFRVLGSDGVNPATLLYESPELTGADAALPINVSLEIGTSGTYYDTILLEVVSPDPGTASDHADWADARLTGLPRRKLGTMTVRDFQPGPIYNGIYTPFWDGHPDFQQAIAAGMQGLVEDQLDPDGKPVLNASHMLGQGAIHSPDTFSQWYRDIPGVNLTATLPFVLVERDEPMSGTTGTFEFWDDSFFPIDQRLFGNQLSYDDRHNYSFTAEFHGSFVYEAGVNRSITVASDDDSWLFLNGRLAVDLGGTHSKVQTTYVIDSSAAATLGLVDGGVYPLDLFYAERESAEAALLFSTDLEIHLRPYEYDVEAIDPDGDVVTYELLGTVSDNLEIDPNTGLLEWRPGPLEPGTYPIAIRASDGRGGVDIQEYDLVVTPPRGQLGPGLHARHRSGFPPGQPRRDLRIHRHGPRHRRRLADLSPRRRPRCRPGARSGRPDRPDRPRSIDRHAPLDARRGARRPDLRADHRSRRRATADATCSMSRSPSSAWSTATPSSGPTRHARRRPRPSTSTTPTRRTPTATPSATTWWSPLRGWSPTPPRALSPGFPGPIRSATTTSFFVSATARGAWPSSRSSSSSRPRIGPRRSVRSPARGPIPASRIPTNSPPATPTASGTRSARGPYRAPRSARSTARGITNSRRASPAITPSTPSPSPRGRPIASPRPGRPPQTEPPPHPTGCSTG